MGNYDDTYCAQESGIAYDPAKTDGVNTPANVPNFFFSGIGFIDWLNSYKNKDVNTLKLTNQGILILIISFYITHIQFNWA